MRTAQTEKRPGVGWQPIPLPMPRDWLVDARKTRFETYDPHHGGPRYDIGADRAVGDVAERLVAEWMTRWQVPHTWHKSVLTRSRMHDFDIGQFAVEMKTTCFACRPDAMVYVDAHCIATPNDWYLFGIFDSYNWTLWLVGAMEREAFFDGAIFTPNGTPWPCHRPGVVRGGDTYVWCRSDQLVPVRDFMRYAVKGIPCDTR